MKTKNLIIQHIWDIKEVFDWISHKKKVESFYKWKKSLDKIENVFFYKVLEKKERENILA